jgi:hypothetical protein
MSVTKQIVKLLSAKYNFSSEEGLEYVTTQLKTLKSMTKEEKAALIIQQKEQAKADTGSWTTVRARRSWQRCW